MYKFALVSLAAIGLSTAPVLAQTTTTAPVSYTHLTLPTNREV